LIYSYEIKLIALYMNLIVLIIAITWGHRAWEAACIFLIAIVVLIILPNVSELRIFGLGAKSESTEDKIKKDGNLTIG